MEGEDAEEGATPDVAIGPDGKPITKTSMSKLMRTLDREILKPLLIYNYNREKHRQQKELDEAYLRGELITVHKEEAPLTPSANPYDKLHSSGNRLSSHGAIELAHRKDDHNPTYYQGSDGQTYPLLTHTEPHSNSGAKKNYA
jgi:hypothetical protein